MTTHPERALSYRPDIDGLRAVAILAVLGFHAFPAAVPGGFVGVDVFFVISGFLISGLILRALDRGTFTFGDFYRRRILRIFPALVVVLAASLVYGWFVLLATEYRQLGLHAAAGAAFTANIALWREAGYFDAPERKPLLHLWSLGVEEQFYFLWPALLVAAYRRAWRLGATIAAIAAASFLLNVAGVSRNPIGTFYLPLTRLWELLLGGLLAWAALRDPAPIAVRGRSLLALLGLTLIVIAAVVLHADSPFPGWWALVPTAGAALIIAAGPAAWLNRVVLSRRSVVLIGLISYPLYLWHWPLLVFAKQVGAEAVTPLVAGGLVAVAFVLAWLTYRFVERPIRFGGSAPTTRRVAWLSAAMVTVAAVGSSVAAGLVSTRLDRRFEFLSRYEYDYRSAYRGKRCHLAADQAPGEYASECVDASFGRDDRTSVFLWGDSHGAHLVPGLRELSPNRGVAVAQYTADRCVPLVDSAVDGCTALGLFVLDRIRQLAPDVVVLASTWNEEGMGRIRGTIDAIRQQGVARIVVVGPVPRWLQVLPRALIQFMQAHPLSPPPRRMQYQLDPLPFTREAQLRRGLGDEPVTYVSALDVFCEEDGCLTEADGEPTSWDGGHLTGAGSRVLAAAVLDRIAGPRASNAAPPAMVAAAPGSTRLPAQ